MPINGVNSDLAALFSSASSKRSDALNSNLNISDFFTLLAAQIQNQDMMNPMSDTEFMGQLAQFSTMQSIQSLAAMNSTAYSVSLIGKEITTAVIDRSGQLVVETGIVTGVGLYNGDPIIYVGEDNAYSLNEIMIVATPTEKIPAPVIPEEEIPNPDEIIDPPEDVTDPIDQVPPEDNIEGINDSEDDLQDSDIIP